MGNPFAFTFPGGQLKQEVTSLTLVNNTAKTVDITVPADKRWKFNMLKVVNVDNVNRAVTFTLYKEVGKTNIIQILWTKTVTAGAALVWPLAATPAADNTMPFPMTDGLIMNAGNTISIVFATGGASAGATDADGIVADYLEIDA